MATSTGMGSKRKSAKAARSGGDTRDGNKSRKKRATSKKVTRKRSAPSTTSGGKRAIKKKRAPAKGRKGKSSRDLGLLERRIEKLTSLLDIAKAMTAERDLDSLLKLILDESVKVISADRCSLWIVDDDRNEIWTKVAQGLEQNEKIRLPIGLGIAGQVAKTGKTINIADAYADSRFNRQVDKDTGYRTRNILAVAMFSTTGDVTGVLQALNKTERGIDQFTAEDEELLLALGANAAAAIENAILYEEIDSLFEGFVKASVTAIESRDPTTSGHSERVALLTTGIAQSLERVGTGPYRTTTFSRNDMKEIRYAALLHDFGKVGVREDVLVKAKKLYPGQLEIIETRFAALYAQRENRYLRATVKALREGGDLPADYEASLTRDLEELQSFLDFVRKCNQPTVLESGGFERLRQIAGLQFQFKGEPTQVVTGDELECLSIPRGSLDQSERLEIESHVTHTFRFLAQIPWTRMLRRVPEIAYAHHEKLDGAGYPRQLSADQIPVQSRMMTIADIYDALTASDRPYKKAVPHTKAVDILTAEAKQSRLDRPLLDIFLEAKVFEALPAMRRG